ncbi:MAG: hypothetical protein RR984_03645, partial [Bacilli bacterium]
MKKQEEILKTYITPDFVYIPIKENTNILINQNKNILTYEVFGNFKNEKYYSYVSGKVIGTSEILATNNMSKALVVENNFKENKYKHTGVINDNISFKRKEVSEILSMYGISINFTSKKILYATYNYSHCDLCDSFLIRNNCTLFLEALDTLKSIYKLDKVFIVIKNKDLLEELNNYIGTYYNIETINISDKALTNISKKKENILMDINDILEIYNLLKYNIMPKNKYITINYNKKSILLLV